MSSAEGSAMASQPFSEECKLVVQQLRGALIEALTQVGVDPGRPQEVARRLGLHRNLTWKVSKIVASTDAFSAVPHVPGRSGVEILAKALGRAGVDAACVQAVRASREAFEGLVERHAGDRATLDLVASGFVADNGRSEALVQARRDAFRGNSAIWSVQARVLSCTHILAPNADDPSLVDLALINGLIDLRRLRPDVAWPLFRRQIWDSSGRTSAGVGEPLEAGADPHDVPLLRSFCSPGLPDLAVIEADDLAIYELPAGPVGRAGELTCFYGSVVRRIGRREVCGDEDQCELATTLKTPVEMLQMDVLLHDDLGWPGEPTAELLSLLEGRPTHGSHREHASRLTLDADVHELGRGLVSMSTPHVPRYGELLAHAFASTGWSADAFQGYRIHVPYPPIPAQLVFTLGLAPEGGGD